MEDSAFSFLGDSMIETDSVPMMSDVMMGVTASSLPFTPRLGEFETDMAISCDVALQTDPAYLEMQCSCSCHLFRNNPTPEDNICQGTFIAITAVATNSITVLNIIFIILNLSNCSKLSQKLSFYFLANVSKLLA